MKDETPFFGTDMAVERRSARGVGQGVEYRKEKRGSLTVERLTVTTPEGARSIGRPMGHYHTVNTGEADGLDEGETKEAAEVLADVLRELTAQTLRGLPSRVLVAGLGNERLNADAVGPLVCRDVAATRHLSRECPALFEALGCAEVSVIAPGVSAGSGMDAADVICAVAERVHPELIVAVDALAARSTSRLGTTIQVSDTGVIPGGGVGNHRLPLNRETTGVPVFVVGVPTVTDSRVFFTEEAARKGISVPEPDSEEEPYFVCPKSVDGIVRACAKIIASAVNSVYGIR